MADNDQTPLTEREEQGNMEEQQQILFDELDQEQAEAEKELEQEDRSGG